MINHLWHEMQRLQGELKEKQAELDWLYEHHNDIVTDYRSDDIPVYWLIGGGDFNSYETKQEAVAVARKIEAKQDD